MLTYTCKVRVVNNVVCNVDLLTRQTHDQQQRVSGLLAHCAFTETELCLLKIKKHSMTTIFINILLKFKLV